MRLFFAFCFTCAAAPAGAQLVVGTASATPGQRAYGEIVVPAGVDSGTNIPVIVVSGAKPGRTVAFVTGAHGTEYVSIVAMTRLADRIDAARLTGAVIIVPLINVASFDQMKVHTNPVDGKGMNASYPGNAAGTQTERALALIADQVIKRADVVIDLHGGDLDEDLRPYSYWMRTGDAAQDSAGLALARAFGLDHVIINDVDVATNRRNASSYALSLGKPVLVAEAGRSGTTLPDDVEALVAGSLDVLGSLGMMAHARRGSMKPMVWLGNDARVRADRPGMFFAAVGRDARVTKGDKIGYTTDYAGRPTGDVLAPTTGLVTFIRGVPSMWKGATLVNVCEIFPSPPPYKKPA